MKIFNTKQAARQKDINLQLRQIRRLKYERNMEQKKIFEHLIKNSLELDLKKPEQAKILANGIPQTYREIVWPQLLKNNHGVTPKLYEILLKKVIKASNQILDVNRNQELHELQLTKSKSQGYAPSQQINLNLQRISKWLDTIKMDIPRTFSEMKIFQSVLTGPNKKSNSMHINQINSPNCEETASLFINNESKILYNLLSCWVMYRDDIGYRQGMSQIAGYLYIELNNEIAAFQIFCSLVTSDTIYQFFTMNLQYISSFCQKISFRLRQRNEEMFQYFDTNQLDYKLFVLDWVFSLFTKCFQLDTVGKIWDLLLLNAMDQKIIINVIVQIICSFQLEIYSFNKQGIDTMEICRFLKKLKVDEVKENEILQNLKNIKI